MDTETHQHPRRRPPRLLLIALAIGLAIGGVQMARWVWHRQHFVGTNDALVQGDLITISPRIAGRINALLVEEGAQVHKGDVLARLDDLDAQAQLASTQAALTTARSQLVASQLGVTIQASQTTAQIEESQAALATAQSEQAAAQSAWQSAQAQLDKAAHDHQRMDALYQEGGVSHQQVEAMQTALTAARAQLAAAQARVTASRNQVQAAHTRLRLAQAGADQVELKKAAVATTTAQIHQAQTAVSLAHLTLDHTVITAPADGTIALRSGHLGEQVQPGQALFKLSEWRSPWITTYIEETEIERLKPGAQAHIRVDAFPRLAFHGHVAHVGAAAGNQFSLFPPNNAAGNFTKVVQRIPVRLELDQPPAVPLRPGMSCEVEIEAAP